MTKDTELQNEKEVLISSLLELTSSLLENEMPIGGHHEEAEDTDMEFDNPFHANAKRIDERMTDGRITEEGYVYPGFKQPWHTRVYNTMIDLFKSIGRRNHNHDFNNPLSDAFSQEKDAINVDTTVTGFDNPLYGVFSEEKHVDLQDAEISDKSELTNTKDTASNKLWYQRGVFGSLINWAQSARKGIVSGMVGLLQSMRYMIDTAIAKIESSVDTDVKKSVDDIDEEFNLTKSLLVQEEIAAVDRTFSLLPYAPAYEEIAPSDHQVLEVATRIEHPKHQKIEKDLISFD